MRVLIIGAGGHGQVVADILWQMQRSGEAVTPIGYLDDDQALTGVDLSGLPVLGTTVDIVKTPHEAVIIAIGNGRLRRRLFHQLQAQGEQFVTACHPTAIIASHVSLGHGCMVGANVVINSGTVVGDNVILNTACTVDHHNRIGHHVHIGPGAHLGGDVTIGEGTLIGIGATVLPQRQIGVWSTIGGGAVVTQHLGDGVTAVGVPARVIKTSQATL